MSYQGETAALFPLATLDAQIFTPSPQYSIEVCRFILALAVVHEDLKDLVLAHVLLTEVPPGVYSMNY